MAQIQGIFYVHQTSIMVNHCSQHKQNPPIHLRYITSNIQQLWNNGHICYIFAQSQDMPSHMYQSLLSLIAVPNMNKINPFFSKITQQQYESNHMKLMKDITIITEISHGEKCYFTCISNTWHLIVNVVVVVCVYFHLYMHDNM